MDYRSDPRPVIVVGAGIIGLTLAQGLKKVGILFEFYERDSTLNFRSPGWGINSPLGASGA
jgi:2-polyprenyl-6-methoxyphenol hydroxylase-like FAD-dependent oxidoreductase